MDEPTSDPKLIAERNAPVKIMILAATKFDSASEDTRGKAFAEAVVNAKDRLESTLKAHLTFEDEETPEKEILIVTDEYGTPEDLSEKMSDFFSGAHLALFYFIGHGQLDAEAQTLRLCFFGFNPAHPNDRNISTEQISKSIRHAKPTACYVILDCCHASYGLADIAAIGSRIPMPNRASDANDLNDSEGVFGLFASSVDHQAMIDRESKKVLFTSAFCDILENGVDRLEDWISLDTVFRELRERMLTLNVPAPLRVATLDDRAVYACRNRLLPAVLGKPGALQALAAELDRFKRRLDSIEDANSARLSIVNELRTRFEDRTLELLNSLESIRSEVEKDRKIFGRNIFSLDRRVRALCLLVLSIVGTLLYSRTI